MIFRSLIFPKFDLRKSVKTKSVNMPAD